MHCKILFMLIVSVATVSLVPSSGFSQCNQSNGAGNNCAGLDQARTGGTFFPGVEIPPYTTQKQTLPLDGGVDLPPVEPGAVEAENPLLSGETITVVIAHPSGAADITVRSFSDRNEAVQLVQQLNQRFWVAYTNSDNQRGYREAKSAVDITSIVNEILASGLVFTGATPVVARIALPADTSLEKLLGGETVGPLLPVDPDISLENKTEESTDASQLKAIEGIWAAVARSSNGELRTIELKLDSGGWARLTIPDGSGQTRTIERRAVVEDGQLKLQDGDQEMLLGQIVQVKLDQFVVTRDNGQITFLKQ